MFHVLLLDSLWSDFIGRFHPAIVHFPIGFLLIAAALEVGRRWGKIEVSEGSVTFILFWSAVTATIACIAGFLLSSGGGYDEDLLNSHMWKGIAVAVLAWVAWLFKSDRLKKILSSPKVIYMPALLSATVLTMVTGHDCGTLTHGQGYLTQYTPEPFRAIVGLPAFKETDDERTTEVKPIADIQQAVVYTDIVQPILKARCIQCHSENKKKGGLRMDELALMIKGGESGPALVAGSSATSDMIKRCLLPETDEKHMPPKGKPQLSTDQIALLSWWIDQGAPADKKVSELKMTEVAKPALAALSGGANNAASAKKAESAVLSVKVPEGNVQAIENLRKTGLIVNALSQDQNLVEVSAVNAPNFSDKEIELLKPLAQQIAWLKLGGTKITDAGLDQISKFPHLAKLHLERTNVTDKGIAALKGLEYLEYLNIIGTKVGDAGLKTVAGMSPLRSVYVWQSAVTDSAVAQVGRQSPGLLVVNGFNEAAVARFLQAGDTTSKK